MALLAYGSEIRPRQPIAASRERNDMINLFGWHESIGVKLKWVAAYWIESYEFISYPLPVGPVAALGRSLPCRPCPWLCGFAL